MLNPDFPQDSPFHQNGKLAKLNLRCCVKHGALYSARSGGRCKKCAAAEPIAQTKTCKRGHVRPATQKACAECAKDRRQAKRTDVDLSGPVADDKQRAANQEAEASRKARRAGLGLHQTSLALS